MFFRRITGDWSPVSFVKRWNGTAWVDVSFVRRWNGSSWVQLWPTASTLFLIADTNTATGVYECTYTGTGANPCPVATNVTSTSIDVVASGGSGAGPTYAWTYVSGDTSVTVSNPTSPSVTFSAVLTRRREVEAVWRCTATRGADTAVADFYISFFYDYTRDGEVVF